MIFLSLLSAKAPKKLQSRIQVLGLSLALILRIVLIFLLTKILASTQGIILFKLSLKDCIFIIGGVFLILKSINEIYNDIHSHKQKKSFKLSQKTFLIIQIIFVDLVFSLDSIIAAIGMTSNFFIISLAFTNAMIVMILLSKYVVKLISNFPGIKVIAMMFILLVGMTLVLEGLNIKLNHNYLYFALLFSSLIEAINIMKKKCRNIKKSSILALDS